LEPGLRQTYCTECDNKHLTTATASIEVVCQ
jgi:hypothetical protein